MLQNNGLGSFSVLTINGKLDPKSIFLDEILNNTFQDVMCKKWFIDLVNDTTSVDILHQCLQRIAYDSTPPMYSTDNKLDNMDSTKLLLSEIERIGWDRCTSMNENMSRITLLTRDKSNREHYYDIILDGYPSMSPQLELSFPNSVTIDWENKSTLSSIVDKVENEILSHTDYFDVCTLYVCICTNTCM